VGTPEESDTTSRVLNVEAVQRQLDTRFLGKGQRLLFLPVVDSTNTVAMQLAQQGSEEGTVVLTDKQTAGRGRLGRRWVDIQANHVLLSTILRPQFPLHLLIMVASLAVVDAISHTCQVVASIKWPNDILIGNLKVAGILIETSHDQAGHSIAIVGIGVNVNGQSSQLAKDKAGSLQATQGLAAKATTLQSMCGHAVSRETLIAHLLQSLEAYYRALQQEAFNPVESVYESSSRWIRERWRNQLSTLGRHIEVRQGDTVLSGVAEDVNDTGELLLRRHSGECVRITWGDIGYPAE
jgi:BirA family biotin operon repressor/biotin-[acetyl-CoA-carboxylase] ligase